MPQGLLAVTGTIDLAQFWPAGECDADTVKVLRAGANAFKFRKHAGAPFKVTHAFEGATVKGKVNKPAIDSNNRITIRLQGIDAPELHYRPTAPTLNKKKPSTSEKAAFNANNGNFRQFFGEPLPSSSRHSSARPAPAASSAWCARRSTSRATSSIPSGVSSATSSSESAARSRTSTAGSAGMDGRSRHFTRR